MVNWTLSGEQDCVIGRILEYVSTYTYYALIYYRGRLQTSQLQRLPPNTGDIRLTFLQAPSFALMNQPVPLSLRFDNTSDRTVELDLVLSSGDTGDTGAGGWSQSWSGLVNTSLGLVEPGG